MQVTRIEELTKSRSKVFLDGEPAFVLYKGELKRYHVRMDEELSQAAYEVILGEVLPKRAKLRAMQLLQKKDYTMSQLRRKLEEGFYPPQIIESALEYVAGFHYTDDSRYALQYIMCHADDRSRRRIEQDLLGKGISEDIIRSAWVDWEDQSGGQDEEGMMRGLLRKRGFDPETADYTECQKQAAFLMRKGFPQDKIRRVLRDFQTFA